MYFSKVLFSEFPPGVYIVLRKRIVFTGRFMLGLGIVKQRFMLGLGIVKERFKLGLGIVNRGLC